VALTTHPHLAPRLKKESYTSTPLWAFVVCSRVKFTFTFQTDITFGFMEDDSLLLTRALNSRNPSFFPKISDLTQNSRTQKVDMNEVPS
jgi:hypothetical protein